MARRSRPVLYREAIDAIRDSHSNILTLLQMPRLPKEARELLYLLADRLMALIERDNHRSR